MNCTAETQSTQRTIFAEPYRFEFFQAVRLLKRFGEVRFSAHNSTAFPASEIQAIEWPDSGPPVMQVNFLGLTGPVGVLPTYYTLLVAERIRARDTAMRDFLDIFNHRTISLFYQAWEKYRFTVQHERGERDRVFSYLLDFVGLGTKGLAGRQAVADNSLAYYAGLVAQHPRSAVGLKQLLEDYFEVPVEIEQFAGGWYKLAPQNQTCLGDGARDFEQLAVGAVVGDEVWDEQSRARIRLGPLSLEQYRDFLPTGTAYAPLRALAEFYCGNEIDFEVQLVLRRENVPACELGREDEAAPRLGWTAWARTSEMSRDPGDTILTAETQRRTSLGKT